MSFYSELADTALEMLTEFGQTWTLTTTTAEGVSSSRTAKGVEVKTVKHLLGDSGVQLGDRELLLDASANPMQGDRITDGTNSYVLIPKPEPIKPGATVLAWTAWGRAG